MDCINCKEPKRRQGCEKRPTCVTVLENQTVISISFEFPDVEMSHNLGSPRKIRLVNKINILSFAPFAICLFHTKVDSRLIENDFAMQLPRVIRYMR